MAAQRLLASYAGHLETSPVITKSLTSCFLNGLGDFIQQNIQGVPRYDLKRTARQATWGLLIPGPSRRIPGSSASAVAKKLLIDQAVCAPLIVTSFFWTTGLLEGRPVDELKAKYAASFWPTMKLNYTLWPAAQVVNFAFVPTAWQVVYVSAVSLVWGVILSAKNSAPLPERNKAAVASPQ